MRVFVRAFPRSRVQWLDVLARSARSASAPRRGRKTGPHAAKHTAAKERANARTREREGDAAPPVLPPHARQPRAQLVSRWRAPQLAGAHELIAVHGQHVPRWQ